MSACICPLCGESFNGVSGFDRHQDRDYSRTPAIICRDPAGWGLVRNEHGRWGFPADPAGRERLASLAAGREES